MKKIKANKVKIHSKREYALVLIDGNMPESVTCSLEDILTEDFEVYYALQYQLDELLDLKVGDVLNFQPIRDNKDTCAIIKRIL